MFRSFALQCLGVGSPESARRIFVREVLPSKKLSDISMQRSLERFHPQRGGWACLPVSPSTASSASKISADIGKQIWDEVTSLATANALVSHKLTCSLDDFTPSSPTAFDPSTLHTYTFTNERPTLCNQTTPSKPRNQDSGILPKVLSTVVPHNRLLQCRAPRWWLRP